MRRFARGVTTDSHQLYGLFMARLSLAIFEWDDGDVARLTEAKQSEEGRGAHIKLSAKELARHCRRRTRGVAETERLLQEAEDTMGVPLIDRQDGGDLEHAAPAPRLHPGPCRSGALHPDGGAHQRRGAAPRLQVRQRLHFPGVVPPAPVPLHTR